MIPRYIAYILKRDRNKDISNYCRFEGSLLTVLITLVGSFFMNSLQELKVYLSVLIIVNFLFMVFYLYKHLKNQGAL